MVCMKAYIDSIQMHGEANAVLYLFDCMTVKQVNHMPNDMGAAA